MRIIFIGGIILTILAMGIIFYLFYPSALNLSSPSSIELTNTSSPGFSFNSNKAGTISYSGDCNSSTTSATKGINTIKFVNLSDGTYSNCQITVSTSKEKTFTLDIPAFTIDTSKPTTTANSSKYKNGEFAKSVTINFICNDSGSGCNGETHYKINRSLEKQGNSITFNTSGVYSLEYWNIDNAGNEENHNTEFNNIRIDLESTPSPIILTRSGYKNRAFNLTYSPTKPENKCYYKIDVGTPKSYGPCLGIFSNLVFSKEYSYSIIIYENNSAGNTGSSGEITITWKTTPPNVTILLPLSGNYNSTTWPGIVLDNYEDAITCQYSSDESSWNDFNSCEDTSNYQVINGTLYIRGIDEAGNIADSDSVTFTYQD